MEREGRAEPGNRPDNPPIAESSTLLPQKGDIYAKDKALEKHRYKIVDWLDRVEDARSRNKDPQGLIEGMKKDLYKRYVIKPDNIPQAYWNFQTINPINVQKSSLDKWVNYLTSGETKLPMWAKDWVLRGVLTMERLEKNEDEEVIFKKRGKSTTASFPSLNKKVLTETIRRMKEELREQPAPEKGRKDLREKFQDRSSKKLLSANKFAELYAQCTNESNQEIPKHIQGEWRHFTGTSDAQILVASYEGYNVPWCSKDPETAEDNLECGDYHIYYTHDHTGKAVVPRILLYIEDAEIMEVRGIGYKQNLDKEIAPFIGDILEINYGKKAEEYQKKATNMKRLAEIEAKQKNNEKFSKEDILFLYELDESIEGFGYEKDPSIKKILKKRHIKKDLAFALDTEENRISLTKEDALSGGIDFHYGNLHLDSLNSLEGVTFPKGVKGNIYLKSLTSVESLILPEKFRGILYLGEHFNEKHPEVISLKSKYPNLTIHFYWSY